jgi:putative Mg2+ transporter-C (MgtC) family protein
MTFLYQQLHYLLDFGPALLVALLLGMFIGWERYRQHRAPTVSTFIVLAVGSSMAVRTQIVLYHGSPPVDWALPAAVLTAVGFCGGAFIIWREHGLEGVTTGMIVFFTAVIGIVVGLGLYLPAVVATVLTLFAMSFSAKRWPGTGDLQVNKKPGPIPPDRPLPLSRHE